MKRKAQEGSYYTGEYRSLFREIGKSDEEINNRLELIWSQLFEGNENTRIYYPTEDGMAYILDTGNLDVRTEGMSYGMMMAVQMNQKEVFDKLWKWTKTHMFMTSGRNDGYFAWSCSPDGKKNSMGPAPDGEEYFAMALFFASHRWGEGREPFNYSVQAKNLLKTCLHKGEKGEGNPMWDKKRKLIKFVPDCEFSNPSYHLPHFYELFSLWSNEEDQLFWKEAAMASREYLKLCCHPVTGLAPEYAFYDGPPNHEKGYGFFFSDSYRVAANIGLDYEWFRGDDWVREEANKLQAFFTDIDPQDYRRYSIAGEPFEEKALHPVGLLATTAMVSLAADHSISLKWVDKFWNTEVRTGVRRYYDNCLYFFSFLALSGKYKIWFPEGEQITS